MFHQRSLRIFLVAGVIALLVVAMTIPLSFADDNPRLQGLWKVTITGVSGAPPSPSQYHVIFGPRGGLTAKVADPFLNTGYGLWRKVGERTFAVTILMFQFDASGQFLGTEKVQATLELNKKSDVFDSDDYHFEFFNPDGTSTGITGDGTAHGTRLQKGELVL
jgi:hypothetical protein